MFFKAIIRFDLIFQGSGMVSNDFSLFFSYRRLLVVPGHERCEGPDRARLRPDMDSFLSPEKNQGWVTLSIIETRFFSFLPKKNEAR